MNLTTCSKCGNEWSPLPFVTDKECPRCLHPVDHPPGPVFTEGQKLYGIDSPGIYQHLLWQKDLAPGKIKEVTYIREHGIVAGERAIWVADEDGKEKAAHLKHYPFTSYSMADQELYRQQFKLVTQLEGWIDAIKANWVSESEAQNSPAEDVWQIPTNPTCDVCGNVGTLTQIGESRRLFRCFSCIGTLSGDWAPLQK